MTDKTTECDTAQNIFSYTLGDLFSDGAGIDLLQDHRLVLWSDGHEVVATTIDYAEHKYVASPLDSKWLRALRLPAATADFGTAEALLLELSSAIAPWACLSEDSRLLVAAWVLSTWTLESLPSPPCLNLCGAPGFESPLLEVLTCLCRRPLSVTSLALSEVSKVPAGVCTTLVCRQPSLRGLQQFLSAGAEAALKVLVGGEPRSLRYALLVHSPQPMPLPVLNVQALSASTPYRRLTGLERDNLLVLLR